MKIVTIFASAAAVVAAAGPASAANISGARVEAIVGWDKPDFDFDAPGNDPDADGIVYGIGAGYDFALGKTVAIGIDVEASDSSTELNFASAGDTWRFEAGRDLYAGARFTAAASDRLNLYGKAGYTNARVKASFTSPTFAQVIDYDADGFRVGLGAQYAVGGKAYVGAEYRYSNYESDLTRHQAVATLGMRF